MTEAFEKLVAGSHHASFGTLPISTGCRWFNGLVPRHSLYGRDHSALNPVLFNRLFSSPFFMPLSRDLFTQHSFEIEGEDLKKRKEKRGK